MSEISKKVVEELPEADLAALLAVDDSTEEWMSIPEWGLRIKLKSISKAEQIRCRKLATRQGVLNEEQFEGLLLLQGIAQPRLTPEHLGLLQSKSIGVVSRIQKRILQLSKMVDEDHEEAEADFQD